MSEILAQPAPPIGQLVKAIGAAERALAEATEVVIGLSSNVTIDLLGLYLRREAVLAGVRARIVMGNYDDPIGDLDRFTAAGVDRVVILPFFDNILPAFEAQSFTLTAEAIDAKAAEVGARYRLALERGRDFRSVQIGLYHRLGPAAAIDGSDAVAVNLDRFNAILTAAAAPHGNVQLVDVAASVTAVGRNTAFDQRFYLRSKAPYSAALLADLASRLSDGTRTFGTRFAKALVLDCDNTLWGGILGEDLVAGVRLDPFEYPGNVYWRVQQAIAALEAQGVLLCLCTKNNPADVAQMFAEHPHMVLRETQIAAKRVDWTDKVTNLRALADELNIGLDSMIFLDDSLVEIEAVRAQLPQVTVIQVPAALPNYPATIDRIARLFRAPGGTGDGASRTEQYRIRTAATEAKAAFASHEDYLASLDLEVTLRADRPEDAARIAELSQKSNQFNLTTRRYTRPDIERLMATPDARVISLCVRNRFGDAGLTGILVLRFADAVATVEAFLMSCRVLGQGVENAIWSAVFARLRADGIRSIEAAFVATAKNAQVRDFYDRIGLDLQDDTGVARRYSRSIADFTPPATPWIKVSDV